MKYLLICILIIFLLPYSFAQQKVKIAPPPPLNIKPPPKLIPSPQFTAQLNADPLQENVTTFWTDTLYSRTDSSFLVTQWNFSPSGTGTARLTKMICAYPRAFTKDSIYKKHDRIASVTKDTYFQDGGYSFSSKPPKAAERLIFTDQQTRQHTIFIIKWMGKGAARKIAGLTDETLKTNWKPGPPPAFDPVTL